MVYAILVVDNIKLQRELLVQYLQNRLGYQTFAVASRHEATRYFSSDSLSKPDLILMDSSSGDSAEALEAVKMLSAYAPVISLIKYGDFDMAVSILNAGANDFLIKPVAMERLSTTFRNVIQLRDMRREVEKLRQERMQDASILPSAPHDSKHYNQYAPLSVALTGEDGNVRRMQDIEAEAIRFAMQYYHGRMTEVARRLGIGRSTLYRKLSEFSIKQSEAA